MIVYRIVKEEYANDLSGEGARIYGGRWNSKGIPVLYTSPSLSLAILECLVHLNDIKIPPIFVTVEIEIPQVKPLLFTVEELPDEWNSTQLHYQTQQFGDAHLIAAKRLCLKFPSAVNPLEHNILINPLHKRFPEVKIKKIYPFIWDERLLK